MFGGGFRSGGFEAHYRVHSIAFLENKAHLENGDKILLPPSALDQLAALRIDYPMLFQIHAPGSGKTSHCGVMEFVAEEGQVYLPNWMMENLALGDSDIVRLRNATLPKAGYVKLQPETKDFLDISNPKAVLEKNLRNYSCLTVGDKILVNYNNRKYYIGIVEAKPAEAVTIIETDCEVDFAAPLDYVEPVRAAQKTQASQEEAQPRAGFGTLPPSSRERLAAMAAKQEEGARKGNGKGEEEEETEEPSFIPFGGSGRKLNGKTASPSKSKPIPVKRNGGGGGAGGGGGRGSSTAKSKSPTPTGTTPPIRQMSGKLVFGAPRPSVASNGAGTAEDGNKVEEKNAFAAFKGKSYKL